MAHMDLGRKLLEKLSEELKEIGKVESPPRLEGRTMILLLAPTATMKAKTAKRSVTSEPQTAS